MKIVIALMFITLFISTLAFGESININVSCTLNDIIKVEKIKIDRVKTRYPEYFEDVMDNQLFFLLSKKEADESKSQIKWPDYYIPVIKIDIFYMLDTKPNKYTKTVNVNNPITGKKVTLGIKLRGDVAYSWY